MSFGHMTDKRSWEQSTVHGFTGQEKQRKHFTQKNQQSKEETNNNISLSRYEKSPNHGFDTTSRVILPDEKSSQYSNTSMSSNYDRLDFQREDKLRREQLIANKANKRNAHLDRIAKENERIRMKEERIQEASIKKRQELMRNYMSNKQGSY